MILFLCPCMPFSISFPLHFTNILNYKPHTNHIKFKPVLHFTNLNPTHVSFCSRNEKFHTFSENERLGLLNKPSSVPFGNGSSSEIERDAENGFVQKEDVLKPLLKIFNESDSLEEETKMVNCIGEYYEPKPGDFVVGVVVGGNENRLSVNVGAELEGTMLTKEVLPLYSREMKYLFCDEKKEGENFVVQGRMGILRNDDMINGVMVGEKSSVVEIGTVLFAEVLGRTLTGRPLLSSRRLFCRIAWHRLR
ncbi:hypothetical protein RYX36_009253 [Vicia faba]